ncbi:hypothetical protein T492DRAFT_843491 [Pavlovales sp. CCMP2436]|nr:hypothetical protein T492DRAFT_843491 [Pavlovales sp. CCMP2436]
MLTPLLLLLSGIAFRWAANGDCWATTSVRLPLSPADAPSVPAKLGLTGVLLNGTRFYPYHAKLCEDLPDCALVGEAADGAHANLEIGSPLLFGALLVHQVFRLAPSALHATDFPRLLAVLALIVPAAILGITSSVNFCQVAARAARELEAKANRPPMANLQDLLAHGNLFFNNSSLNGNLHDLLHDWQELQADQAAATATAKKAMGRLLYSLPESQAAPAGELRPLALKLPLLAATPADDGADWMKRMLPQGVNIPWMQPVPASPTTPTTAGQGKRTGAAKGAPAGPAWGTDGGKGSIPWLPQGPGGKDGGGGDGGLAGILPFLTPQGASQSPDVSSKTGAFPPQKVRPGAHLIVVVAGAMCCVVATLCVLSELARALSYQLRAPPSFPDAQAVLIAA